MRSGWVCGEVDMMCVCVCGFLFLRDSIRLDVDFSLKRCVRKQNGLRYEGWEIKGEDSNALSVA